MIEFFLSGSACQDFTAGSPHAAREGLHSKAGVMVGFPFFFLRARLVLLVLVAVLPALGLALHAGIEQRRAAGARVRDDTLLLTRLASANHERLVELTGHFLATLTQLPEIRQGAGGACDALLDTATLRRHGSADSIARDTYSLQLTVPRPGAFAAR